MRYVLITGASGGIGQAVARLAAARGLDPVCVGRSGARMAELFPGYRRIEADVTDESQVAQLFERLEAEDILPQALVHCVGSTLIGPLERIGAAQYAEVMRVNLGSSFLMGRRFIAALRGRSLPGSMVMFSSVVSRIGVANHEVIAAAKAGIEGFAISAAASYAAQGIRLNVVAPGLTETPLTQRMLASEAGRAAATKQYPIPGINQAEDVAEAALWLASPQSSRVTGQVIAVDGGFSHIRPLVR